MTFNVWINLFWQATNLILMSKYFEWRRRTRIKPVCQTNTIPIKRLFYHITFPFQLRQPEWNKPNTGSVIGSIQHKSHHITIRTTRRCRIEHRSLNPRERPGHVEWPPLTQKVTEKLFKVITFCAPPPKKRETNSTTAGHSCKYCTKLPPHGQSRWPRK